VLVILFCNIGCIDNEKKHRGSISYDQAIAIAKKYALDRGLYKSEDIKYLYEPDNATWIASSSRNPKMLEEIGLANKQYYAVYFYYKNIFFRDSETIVFVEKDTAEIIGVFREGEFKKNTLK
jgi:hypothetical protein